MLVLGDGIADILEELVLLLATLFRDLGKVEGLGAFRLGHCGREKERVCVCERDCFW